MSSISRGTEAELMVCSLLTKNNFKVSLPISHDSQYDIIADNGEELLKIQVKRAFIVKNKGYDSLVVETIRKMTRSFTHLKSRKQGYSQKGYDYLIACDLENNNFWIIPKTVETKAQLYLNMDKYYKYKDNWSILNSKLHLQPTD